MLCGKMKKWFLIKIKNMKRCVSINKLYKLSYDNKNIIFFKREVFIGFWLLKILKE